MKGPGTPATPRERGAEARRNAKGGWVGFTAEGRPFRDGVFSFTWTDADEVRHAVLVNSYDEAAEFMIGFNDWGDPVKEEAA